MVKKGHFKFNLPVEVRVDKIKLTFGGFFEGHLWRDLKLHDEGNDEILTYDQRYNQFRFPCISTEVSVKGYIGRYRYSDEIKGSYDYSKKFNYESKLNGPIRWDISNDSSSNPQHDLEQLLWNLADKNNLWQYCTVKGGRCYNEIPPHIDINKIVINGHELLNNAKNIDMRIEFQVEIFNKPVNVNYTIKLPKSIQNFLNQELNILEMVGFKPGAESRGDWVEDPCNRDCTILVVVSDYDRKLLKFNDGVNNGIRTL